MEASHMLAECNQKQRKRTKEVVLCKYEYRWALALYSLLMLQSCCQFFWMRQPLCATWKVSGLFPSSSRLHVEVYFRKIINPRLYERVNVVCSLKSV